MRLKLIGPLFLLLAIRPPFLAVASDGQAPIEMGRYRQLFIDDYVIAKMQGVKQVLNQPKKHPLNPVLVPEYPWEGVDVYLYGSVLYDESEKVFKMWYNAWGPASSSRGCYATSKDGIHWDKPQLGIVQFEGSKDNNLIDWRALGVTYAPDEPNPARRYKSFNEQRGICSRDGVHWSDPPAESRNIPGDIVSDDVIPFCYDELSDRYVAFGKVNRMSGQHNRRSVSVAFSKDFLQWTKAKAVLIPDARDDELAVMRTAQLRDRVTFFEEDANLRSAQFYQMGGFPYG